MNHITARLLALLLLISVSACDHAASNHNVHINLGVSGVSLKNGAVVIKLKGHDQARVNGAGQLSIGGADVAVSPQAQAALARYNASAVAFNDQAVDLGMEGADFALHTIGQVFEGLFNGTTDQAGKAAERGGKVLEARAKVLCQTMEQWRQAQDAAAIAAPQFRPYAVITADDAKDCFVDDSRDPPPSDPKSQIAT